MGRFTGLLGLLTMLALAFIFSTNRRAIRVKTVAWGLGLQFVLAIFVLRMQSGEWLFARAGYWTKHLLDFSYYGSTFMFGELGKQHSSLGLIFAFQVLPTIIFIAAFFAVLYHLGIMQFIIRAGAWVMTKVMGASGAESLNLAASIFMGQTEAPLTIRPFLAALTQSELMTVMTSGMAHISGGMMAAYIAVGGADAKNLLTAVIMTAPGTLLISKMLVPETEKPLTAGRVEMPHMEKEANVLGAIARGTLDGLQLALNVGAVLIVFIALLALVNAVMGWIHIHISWFPYSLEEIFGWVFAPVAWLIGIRWHDAASIGNLLGTRMVINEFVAFAKLGTIKSTLDPRSFTIATFALCGFANFSSIGIQIGGIGALAPNRRGDLARLGLRAMLAGTMANLMSASIAGMLIS
ncbi:MAG TPA: nucleoside transporter C-terminal domain-containing protein [Terriglobales bacterium]|jgi:CNT family concentrative nucleoside transporter|nr:nucleoside transporter C-terminal domain-containing protein [Terriglobales bacterium]